jgi:hypothetical protein
VIKVSGVLTVRRISGRNGRFNIGRLATPIGDFAVKDAAIEEYEEGRYEGEFGLDRIYLANYTANGRLVTELRARLGAISLTDVDETPVSAQTNDVEPDPLDEAVTVLSVVKPVVAATSSSEPMFAVDSETEATTDDGMVSLFGELWPLSGEVRLDPAVDRVRFRLQRDALKVMGYQFDPIQQRWLKK